MKDVRIGLGSVAPTPLRAMRAEEFLRGKELTDRLFSEAAGIAAGETRPRARPDYRREITKVLVEDALKEAADRARRNGG